MIAIRAQRRVCVVTGSRAEYGLLAAVIRAIAAHPALLPLLIVTGSHLSARHGNTIREIAADGIEIAATVDMGFGDDSPVGIATALARGTEGLARAFADLKPDIVVLLGDRFEILAAAQAAMIARLPIAHLHGGEVSEGAIDEAMRHAVTKMAHLHFVACEEYRRRVMQLGESPTHVHNVGALATDAIRNTTFLEVGELGAELDLDLGKGFFLVTYHPVTLDATDPKIAVRELLAALDSFPERQVVFTGVNADPGNVAVDREIAAYAKMRPNHVRAVASLGYRRYLSAMRLASAVVGNSSSGLLEAPYFRVPTVNVGSRQDGRVRAPSVIDCEGRCMPIVAAISQALDPAFRAHLKTMEYPFGDGGAAKAIAHILATTPLDGLVVKRFHDLPAMPGCRQSVT